MNTIKIGILALQQLCQGQRGETFAENTGKNTSQSNLEEMRMCVIKYKCIKLNVNKYFIFRLKALIKT